MDVFDLRKWEGFTLAGGSLSEPAIVDQIVIDSRRIDSSHALFIALKGKREDGHNYVEQAACAGAKFALVSQQWQPSLILPNCKLLRVINPLRSFQAIVKAYRQQLHTKVIGITGSFGKTMVKDLLYDLLRTEKQVAASPESFNSQIGVALSLLTLGQQHDFAIIEAAISHPGEMDALVNMIQPNYTLLTPIGKKHLATLQDVPTLIEETMKLIKKTSSQGWSLLPRDKYVEKHLSQVNCPSFFWGDSYPQLPHVVPLPSSPLSQYQISFPNSVIYQGYIKTGHAYFFNLLNMAIKSAWLIGISSSHILSIIQSYQVEPTRTEIWKSPIGAIFINDTYCCDPQSVDYALKHFEYASTENRKIFVFGGMRTQFLSSHTDYKRIGKVLSQVNVSHLLVVGQKPFRPLIEEVQDLSINTKVLSFESYEGCFSYLKDNLRKGDFILFKGENKLPFDKLTEVFNDSLTNNQCMINLAAIQTNLALIRNHVPKGTRLMVMVKALAYGTDDVHMSKFLAKNGIDILGVSHVDEGVALKRAEVNQAIFSINAAPYEAAKIVKWGLEVGVSDSILIHALAREAACHQRKVKVHLHVNTGMGRFGCRIEEACGLAYLIQSFPFLELEGIMTHFACAEDPREDAFTLNQIDIFDRKIEEMQKMGVQFRWKHAANSSGSLRFHLPQYNMVRLGLAVYGLYGSEAVKRALDLRLAISLTSRIVGINFCKKGESISYGRKYCVKREMQKIAVLPIGYFDGLHRHYAEKAYVLVQGQKAPMVGNICMDNVMIDVTDIPHVEIGDKVLIFGEDEYGYYVSPEELAMSGNSIVYELMTCLGPRIPRIFIYEESKQVR